jgi:hypothetical protein
MARRSLSPRSAQSYQTALTFPNGLPAGAVTLVAVYSGDSNYSGSSGSINEIVIGLPASLVVTATTPYTNPQSANDNPANATGPSIPLTATLTVASKIIPTGKVSFYSGTTASPTLIGVGQLTPGSGGYQATVSETALRALTGTTVENGSIIDNYNIFAVYSGDNYYVPETSPSIPLLIVGPPATVPPCAAAPSMSITATSLSGGIATYSYTITGGTSTPAVGDIIAVTGTTNGSGILNFASGTITSVKVMNSTTGTFTISGFAAGTTLVQASDTGTVSNTCETNTTGAYFSITPTNPTITIASSGVSAPVSGTANLTVISYGGWNGILNFTCSNLPAYTTCNPFPAVPAISPSTPSAPNAGTPILFTINTNVQPPRSTAAGFAWWMCGLLGLGLLLARRRLRRVGMAGFGAVAGLVLLLAASTGAMTGCTTGFNVDSVKTPAGTTNVLVTVSGRATHPQQQPGLLHAAGLQPGHLYRRPHRPISRSGEPAPRCAGSPKNPLILHRPSRCIRLSNSTLPGRTMTQRTLFSARLVLLCLPLWPRLRAPVQTCVPAARAARSWGCAAGAPQTQNVPTLTVSVRRVVVDVVVTDAHGKPVRGLPASQFRVFEDGKPQSLRSFDEHTSESLPPAAQAQPAAQHLLQSLQRAGHRSSHGDPVRPAEYPHRRAALCASSTAAVPQTALGLQPGRHLRAQ